MDSPWLRFWIGDSECAIPLHAVAEVTSAGIPHLIPLVPLQVAGILNVRGEPLPAVDGGVLIRGQPGGPHDHVLVLTHEDARIGILVGHVSQIERSVPSGSGEDETDTEFKHVRWVNDGDGSLGLIDPEALIKRAIELLKDQRSLMGEEPCQSAF